MGPRRVIPVIPSGPLGQSILRGWKVYLQGLWTPWLLYPVRSKGLCLGEGLDFTRGLRQWQPLMGSTKAWILQALGSHRHFLSQTGLVQNHPSGSMLAGGNVIGCGKTDASEDTHPGQCPHHCLNIHSNPERKADLLLCPLYR